tara:strand:- start:2663 stop:3034 length:372 start_codon:yes stop_codon:yes gene_type:complete
MFFNKEDKEVMREILDEALQISVFEHEFQKECRNSLGSLRDAIDNPAWLPELVSSLSELSEAMRGLVRMIEDKRVLEEICINTIAEREMSKEPKMNVTCGNTEKKKTIRKRKPKAKAKNLSES